MKMISDNRTLEFFSWLCNSFFNHSNEEFRNGKEILQPTPKNEKGAVFYIVFVLVFYSAAIVVMIIKYLNSDKKEKHDDAMLEAYFRNMPSLQSEKENQVNKVAIRAFHTLTTAIQDDESRPSSPQSLVTEV